MVDDLVYEFPRIEPSYGVLQNVQFVSNELSRDYRGIVVVLVLLERGIHRGEHASRCRRVLVILEPFLVEFLRFLVNGILLVLRGEIGISKGFPYEFQGLGGIPVFLQRFALFPMPVVFRGYRREYERVPFLTGSIPHLLQDVSA